MSIATKNLGVPDKKGSNLFAPFFVGLLINLVQHNRCAQGKATGFNIPAGNPWQDLS